jgi:hypothetical protein
MATKKKHARNKTRSTKPKSKKLSQSVLLERQTTHATLLAPLHADVTGQDVLGHAAAITIVCACANTSPLNLPRTLAELGVNGTSFQVCVFNGVTNAGYKIGMDDIPNAPSTTLISVVIAIQNAPKA